MDLSQKIKLSDGREIALGDLVSSAGQVEDLKKQLAQFETFQKDVAKLVQGASDIDEEEKLTRSMLKGIGYSDEETDVYIQQRKDAMNQPDDDTSPDNRDGGTQKDGEVKPDNKDEPVVNPNDPNAALLTELQALRKEIDTLKQGNEKTQAEMYRTSLDEGLGAVGTVQEVQALVNKLKDIRGDDFDSSKTVDTIKKMVDREAISALRARYKKDGGLTQSAIKEEVERLTKEVVSDVQAGIGGLDDLGRTPETDPDTEFGLPEEPVKAPEFSKEGSHLDLSNGLTDYTNDALGRIAQEAAEDKAQI